jgi:UDP-3-O-acyl-N-acetylglucosamine deacetylase
MNKKTTVTQEIVNMENEKKEMAFAMQLAWQEYTMGSIPIDDMSIDFECAFTSAWVAAKMHELGFDFDEEYEAHFSSIRTPSTSTSGHDAVDSCDWF